MIIEGVDLGTRQPPSIDSRQNWFSVGVSMARDVVKLDFGGKQQDIPLIWTKVSEANRDSLLTALDAKDWEAITVITDAGDNIIPGVGGTGTGTISTSGTAVTGSGTAFTTQLATSTQILAGGQLRTINALGSNTALSVTAAFSPDLSGVTFQYNNVITTLLYVGNSLRIRRNDQIGGAFYIVELSVRKYT